MLFKHKERIYELAASARKNEEFIGKLQEKYGLAKERAG
jgi:uncharacterized protein YjbJ (UPF0337 family)